MKKTFRQIGEYSLVRYSDINKESFIETPKELSSHYLSKEAHDALMDMGDEEFIEMCKNYLSTTRKFEEKNLDLSQEIAQTLNIGIVTCGNCGNVNLHKFGEDITCQSCGYETDEPSDCPNLFN
jgi:hypothetical protein